MTSNIDLFRMLRIPLAAKLFIVVSGLMLTVATISGLSLYMNARQALRTEVGEKLKSVAATAALQVSSDMQETLILRSDEASPAYRTLKRTLQAIKRANPDARYVYTMRKTGQLGIWQFVLDAEDNPSEVSHLGSVYDSTHFPAMQEAYDHPVAEKNPAKDDWGVFLSGYAPIKDSRGRTTAIIGVDMSLAQLHKEEALLRHTIWRGFFLAVILSILFSYAVSWYLLRPIQNLIQASRRIGDGDLDFIIDTKNQDQIGDLAQAFNNMISGLKESTRDPITGLYNHVAFHKLLGAEMDRAVRDGSSLCIFIMDIDRFKTVNNTVSYTGGDDVLKQMASLLKSELRKGDMAVRYGGDEFAVILSNTDRATGLSVAERLRDNVEHHVFSVHKSDADSEQDGSEYALTVTVTVGLAAYPQDHNLRDGLVMAADIALSNAKHGSRNTVCSYDSCTGGKEHVDPQDLYRILRDPNAVAIQSLAAAVDAKDTYTRGHSDRVSAYAVEIGKAMGLDNNKVEILGVAGLLHDLGKIGVPDSVLNNPGKLTLEEWEIIQKHPSIGGDILRRAPSLHRIVPTVLHHHERWDGSGYPDGLVGQAIPLYARIMAVADAYDAMTSQRPYRTALSVEEAAKELKANAGRQFDAGLVEVFLKIILPDQSISELPKPEEAA